MLAAGLLVLTAQPTATAADTSAGQPRPSHPPGDSDPRTWRALFDSNLTQWEIWIGVPHASVVLPGVPANADGKKRQPLGLNNDPLKVFTTTQEDGETLLVINGQIYGGLTTKESFGNFHLRTQFKWGEKKWEPRLNKPRDNGILYHCTGPQGAYEHVWKRSLEFQVQEKDMGDYYGVAGTVAYMPAKRVLKRWFYDPTGPMIRFAPGADGPGIHAAHLEGDFEKPNGEWNTLEVYTLGRTGVHVVNGHVVLVLQNTANLAEGNQEEPLSAGQLQIQSEGADCYYRRLEIKPITQFPDFIQRALPAAPK